MKRSERIRQAVDDMNEYLIAECNVPIDKIDKMTSKEKMRRYLATCDKLDVEAILYAVAGCYKILIKP